MNKKHEFQATMVIIHITPSLSPKAGGPAVSIPFLCSGLEQQGCEVTLVAGSENEIIETQIPVELFPLRQFPKALRRSPEMRRWLDNICNERRVEIIHSHNLWGMPSYYPYRASLKFNTLHVVSPRGTLTDYSLSTGSKLKSVYWHLVQKNVLQQCAGIHATAESELVDIRRMGINKPVAVIPNGINIPLVDDLPRNKEFLYLGRIHPEKGLERLLQAWHLIGTKRGAWTLRIVGPDTQGYKAFLQKFIDEGKLTGVSFAGPVFGTSKFDEYKSASYFVLPSFTENFGISVIEALSMKVPAIANKGAPWQDLNTYNCGWWIDDGHEPLAQALLRAINTPENLRQKMGENGRSLALSKYSYLSTSEMMLQFYEFLLGRRSAPSFVDQY